MNAKELNIGEWVEYKQHPVSIVEIDTRNERAVIWDNQNNSRLNVSVKELRDDPQCHCDSHVYY